MHREIKTQPQWDLLLALSFQTALLLTFSYDVQHHSKWGERSDHVEKRHGVLNGQAGFSCPVVERADQQRHEEGLEAVN